MNVLRWLREARTAWCGILCLVLLAARALAQAPAPEPRVVAYEGHLELGYDLQVNIEGLAEWAAQPDHDAGRLVLVLNGRAIRGGYPTEQHTARNNLHFRPQILPQNREVWNDLLGSPDALRKPVTLSVGLEDRTPFASALVGSARPLLTVIAPAYGVISLVIVLAIGLTCVLLARRTSLLRDAGPAPAPGQLRPYNLGRCQMAFWFLLTFASYIVIWLITDAGDTITPGLLGLMGISATTALGEVFIDANKDAAAATQRLSLTAEQQALGQTALETQAKLAALDAAAAPAADAVLARADLTRQLNDQRTRLAAIAAQLTAAAPTPGANVSGGFFRDVLSDAQGYSFHRFQIFAWTLALGLVFMSSVYNSLTMPEFSPTLLGLMGMSAGTYIGFKFPEKR